MEQTMNTQPTATKSGILGVFIGLLVGAAAAGIATLLLTPRSGNDTRAMIKNSTLRARDAILFHAREAAGTTPQNGHKK